MQLSSLRDIFIGLVRLGIGSEDKPSITLPDAIDWVALKAFATEQGLLAVVLDGLDKLQPASYDMPAMMKKQWIGEVFQGYEYRYEQYRSAIAELAGYYNSNGFKMMVLKGYSCSLDWPKPEHRPTGDIDIWQFGQQKEADAALILEKKIRIDNSHHHHTLFYWRDFMVENHYDFVNVHAHKSSRELEKTFKQLGEDDSHFAEVYGEKVYLPSSNLHALFLIRHMVAHFVGAKIVLRQVLDWAFFAEKHTKEIDWKWLEELLGKFHMLDFYNCINAICVDDLGFDVKIFPKVQFEPKLKERILNDILSPEFQGDEPRGFLARIAFKCRRWQANAWKQELCYPESRWETFWSGVSNHLLKPSSI